MTLFITTNSYKGIVARMEESAAQALWTEAALMGPNAGNFRRRCAGARMLPTLLDFIGIASDNGRLALGTSGFAGSVRVPDDADRRVMADGLLQQSAAYADLWEPRVAPAPAMPRR